MVEADFIVLQSMIQKAVSNADTFNKVWIATAAVLVSLTGVLLGVAAQFLISYWQRKAQVELAQRQANDQRITLDQQLAMQELASRRIAVANIGQKRQVWIDSLREEIAEYLAIWQDIAWRWEAVIIEFRDVEITDEQIIEFRKPISEKRFVAHEIKIRVQLRLNMKEIKHQDLLEEMSKLENETHKFKRTVSDLPVHQIQIRFNEIFNKITLISQEILKEEWDRVKSDSFVPP